MTPTIPIVLLPPVCREAREFPTDAEFAGRRIESLLKALGFDSAMIDYPSVLKQEVPLAVPPLVEHGGDDAAVKWLHENQALVGQIWIFGEPPPDLAREPGLRVARSWRPKSACDHCRIPAPRCTDLAPADADPHRPDFWLDEEGEAARLVGGSHQHLPPPWRQAGWPLKFISTKRPAPPRNADWIVPDYMRYSRLFAD